MKYKALFLAMMMVMIIGFAGLNVIWLGNYMPQKQNSIIPEPGTTADITQTLNKKEGWGFVKSKDGKPPQVTAHQMSLVKKYNALFIGDATKKQVALTFDMGYEKKGLTPKILETLKKYNLKAGFFLTTHWIETNPELAKQLITDGHIMGNHTVKHKSLPTLSDELVKQEIMGWEKIVVDVTGCTDKHKYMRPPMGEYSERTLKITQDLGYTTAFWSVAIKDWLPMGGPQEAVRGITNQLHNGAVILLHGNSTDVVNGLDQIIKEIEKKGYKIVPLNEI